MLSDLRFAIRALRRDPGFAVAAIVTLTLAIALNVTVYTVMDAVLFRGYPLVHRSDRILFLQERGPANQCCISYADFEDWRSQATSFDAMAYFFARPTAVMVGEQAEYARVGRVSGEFFRVFAVQPIAGRLFEAGETGAAPSSVAIVRAEFARSHF